MWFMQVQCIYNTDFSQWELGCDVDICIMLWSVLIQNLQCTYYVTSVETRVTLVVISSTRRKDKDTKIITSLSDIASRLRNCHIAASLKPT